MQSLPAGTVPVAVKTWPKPAQMRRRGDPNAAPAINATQPTNCVQARPRDACTQGTCSTRRLRACTRVCVHTTPCARARASLSLCARACASVPYGRAHLRAHRRARVRCGGGSKLLLRRRRTTRARENLQRFPAPDGTAVPAGIGRRNGRRAQKAAERKRQARTQTNKQTNKQTNAAAAQTNRGRDSTSKQTNRQQAALREGTVKRGEASPGGSAQPLVAATAGHTDESC